MTCPEPTALQAYLEGRTIPSERNIIRTHLETCADCRTLVLGLDLETPVGVNAPTEPGHPAAFARAEVALGRLVGRYIVLDRLGAGGMGVVYAAYDPELDRKVAVKLIRQAEVGSAVHDLQERLIREAQAMARIAHPNVTSVYDVGRQGDQVFVAMELIDGETLAQWLAQKERSPSEIVDVFVRAGQGLAAAHSAGLVHRDFKPNNVMIDRAGRVRVMDFGLARPTGDRDSSLPSPSPVRLDYPLTASGVLMGTPAYMAPEQLARAPADARTDQFSFCVALYEALCGTRPFLGEDTDALRAAILAHQIQRPARKVPNRLLLVVTRGLDPSPAARWPSMDALVDELGHDPARRRGRWLAALGALVLLSSAGVTVFAARRATVKLCRGGDGKLDGVWDAARKATVVRAFAAWPHGSAQFPRVAALLDRHAAAWVATYTDACEATRVRGEQSAELLDQRMSCLHEELVETGELVRLLELPDAALVDRAPQSISSLSSPSMCDGERLLSARTKIPTDPALRHKATAIGDELAKNKANDAVTHYADALGIATQAAKDAASAHLTDLEARAAHSMGVAQQHLGHIDESIAALQRAAHLALVGGTDETIIKTFCFFSFLLDTQHRQDAARMELDVAQAALERLGGRHDLAAIVLQGEASLLTSEGKFDDAISVSRRAVDLVHESGDDFALGIAQRKLAHALFEAGKLDEAEQRMRQAIAAFAKVQGPDGQLVGNTEGALSDILVALKRPNEAVIAAQHFVDVSIKFYGEDNHFVVVALESLGYTLNAAHRFNEALPPFQRAIAIGDRIHDPSRNVPEVWSLLADSFFELGRFEEACNAAESALAHPMASKLGVGRAGAEFTLATALWELGRERTRALAVAADAEKLYRAAPPGEVGDSLRDLVAWRKQHVRAP